ncbi:MAG TPA: LysM peptidoglycan-binding domain-containing protein, partial [Anaerolineae bacterium]|nr:LysM peptidoglycan-binding domain-containing protein [Anaerolineae bacterium]
MSVQTDEDQNLTKFEKGDSTYTKDAFFKDSYLVEETLLSQIMQYYDEALIAIDDGDFGLAETKIDSAATLSIDVDLTTIKDQSLALRYRSTLASLFKEYGRILRETERINREDPMAWLDELSATDPEQFKNGKWTDEELRNIVKKISLRCDVPLDYNQNVKNAIYFFQTEKRDEVTKWLKRSGRYLTLIQEIFKEEGLPLDMAYLSMIESGFNPKAYSRAQASGLWQFIYSTGRLYGLQRNSWLDERRDPIKSTKAAAQHLNDLYKLYGDWKMAMAAYNCGPTRVTRQYQSGIDDFWSMSLPRETMNYVPSYMAALVISKAPELFGFGNIEYEALMEYDTVDIYPYMDIADAARCAGVKLEEIKDLNPELLGNRTPAGKNTYPLRIPKDTTERFLGEFAKIPPNKYTPPKVDTYIVKRNDTLSEISKKFGVSLTSLMAANNLSSRDASRLRIGQELKIPGSTTKTSSPSQIQRVSSAQKPIRVSPENTFTYTVKKNDNLWLIAQTYRTNIATLQALNNMRNSTRIITGQKILVPQYQGSGNVTQSNTISNATVEFEQITYIIQKNDTLYEIARKYGVTYGEI